MCVLEAHTLASREGQLWLVCLCTHPLLTRTATSRGKLLAGMQSLEDDGTGGILAA